MEQLRRGWKTCYDRRLCGDRALQGRMDFQVTLSRSGRVTRVDVETDGPRLRELVPCMARKLSAIQFPPPDDDSTTLTIPVRFVEHDDGCDGRP